MSTVTDQREIIKRVMADAQARIFTVRFIKSNGEIRKMQVQMAATKFHVKGDAGEPSHVHGAETRKLLNPNLINVWDIQAHAIRSINLDTVIDVKIDKTTVEFMDEAAVSQYMEDHFNPEAANQ